MQLPQSQGELIRWARGERTQAEFAAAHGIDKSCLSRYEAEKLGAPTKLINYCLRQLASAALTEPQGHDDLSGALENAKRTVALLERLAAISG
ncbi:TPA: XRE family transcriptional regulator [Burkholderia aenigmatica]|uniref:XRE family transcriptional regulator n=1 Tax=Burkholderia sp. AU45251 TaxID=3059204 RepID=UPI00264A6EBA|nr:XRE family transcriptional regulator [Burkholderia sp. AU45251]HDR9485285.1 XRE family transcriptional regulator [Burkholderia aenigmatica]MDN7515476.1 XRE family transcriptional regulator [Burkholderia sp. AU45251]HDR9516832.1 XRE family transcriptional regulator [Burkholderia aenigmatica]HDR9593892.1 XRE family transcriptional regulator [Burkholderia aenigmatica]HDR9602198.1 XRE family transcriptional regulator [Burkholderia aenigmatica]